MCDMIMSDVYHADIDECLSQPCEQECMNNIGSFECDCRTGYLIQSDGRNCSGD